MARLTSSSGSGREHVIALTSADPTEPTPSWFAMPYVQGPTLRNFWRDGQGLEERRIPTTFIYHYFEQMCSVMTWLHELSEGKPFQMAHGDLNPGNILLDMTAVPNFEPEFKDRYTKGELASWLPRLVIVDFGAAIDEVDEHVKGRDAYFEADFLVFIETFWRLVLHNRQARWTLTLGSQFGQPDEHKWVQDVHKRARDKKWVASVGTQGNPNSTCLFRALHKEFSTLPTQKLGELPWAHMRTIYAAMRDTKGKPPTSADIRRSWNYAMENEELDNQLEPEVRGQRIKRYHMDDAHVGVSPPATSSSSVGHRDSTPSRSAPKKSKKRPT